MIDPALITSSLLSSQYKSGGGDSLISGLLGPKAAEPFSALSVLQQAASGAEGALTDFVKQYVPNNGKLLQDISAVFALQGLSGESAMPVTAAFVNPYVKALALEQSGAQDESGNSLLSMLL